MTTAEIFEQVAAHKLSPAEAAKCMQQADAEARARKRPSWLHPRVAAVGGAVLGVMLALVGIQRED